MPNTGRPSRDCHLCRQRRVKCDLARPACQRCIKYGAECPGYRDEQTLVFRNADPTSVKRRKKRPQQASSSETPSRSPAPGGHLLSASSSSSLSSLSSSSTDAVVLPLTRPVYEHWTVHSVPIVLNVYSNLDFIKNMYHNSSDNGPLVWAAHLFARTYITNLRYSSATTRHSQEETQRELGTYLGKTLSSVSEALEAPEGPGRDDVLATIWILANYELLIGSLTNVEPLSPWHIHAKGLYSILKSRGVASLYTEKGRLAFWPAYNMVQIQALVSTTECPPESDEWFDAINNTLYPGEGLTLYVTIFVAKVCRIMSRIVDILNRRDFPAASSEYTAIVDQMIEADLTLGSWIAANTSMDHVMDVYMLNVQYSALIKGYHTVQLLINFLSRYPACPIPLQQLRVQRAYCLKSVQNAARGILESVSYAIGPLSKDKDKSPKALFDALKLVWPLSAVYSIPSTLLEQRLAAEGVLMYIGREVGVRQALRISPGTMPLPPEAREPLRELTFYDDSD